MKTYPENSVKTKLSIDKAEFILNEHFEQKVNYVKKLVNINVDQIEYTYDKRKKNFVMKLHLLSIFFQFCQ